MMWIFERHGIFRIVFLEQAVFVYVDLLFGFEGDLSEERIFEFAFASKIETSAIMEDFDSRYFESL